MGGRYFHGRTRERYYNLQKIQKLFIEFDAFNGYNSCKYNNIKERVRRWQNYYVNTLLGYIKRI